MPNGAADRPQASIVIVTRNRVDDLRTALRSATAQLGDPEVVVMDDASTDGTARMVSLEFPDVRLMVSETPRGYIVQRNRAARLVRGDIIVSIDDDAVLSSPAAVATTVAEFDDPRVGAVAMPFVHTARGPEVHQQAPSPDGIWITNAYIGTAHAVRRELFLRLGGYREALEHFFEEPDFCIRLMLAGYVVRLGRADPILHRESPRRNQERGVRYLCRNHVLFSYFYVPFPLAVPRSAGVVAYALRHGLRLGEPLAAVRGLLAGAGYILSHRGERTPVSVQDYRRWRALARQPAPL